MSHHDGPHPHIDGTPLTDIGAFGEVGYTEDFRGGCDTAQWTMNRHLRDSRLRAGARVDIYDSSTRVWAGILAQPGGTGEYAAYGLRNRGSGVRAIDGSSSPTMAPQSAVDAAIDRGAVPWTLPVAISAADLAGDPDPGLMLNELLDRYSDESGLQWRVNHHGALLTAALPTTPTWAVMLPDAELARDDTEYVSHLNVKYLASGLVFTDLEVTTDESEAAATMWGRVERDLDLTGLGIITAGEALSHGEAVLAQHGPRMRLADPITVGPGQLRTLGDTRAGWASVHAGQMLRVWALPDRSRPQSTLHTDVVIGRLERDSTTLTLTPYGSETQTFEDTIAELYAAVLGAAS
jgi:hypothetical protein